jgi:putative aldouronate transport system substrate-binding protein
MKVISQKMQDEGLNIEIKSMVLADHDTKYPLLFSSGADFTMAFDAPWYKMTTLIDQGALAPLEDMVNKNAPKLLEEITPKIFKFNYMKNHLYGVPAAYYYAGTTGVMIREDLRKKYNAPAPTSADSWPSLEPFLKAIKDNEPNLIPYAHVYTWPISIPNGKNGWALGVVAGVGVEDIFNGTTLTNGEDQGTFMESANLVRSWFEKGYIPKQDLPLSAKTQNVLTDYFVPGKTGAYAENEPNFKYVEYNKQLKAAFPDAEAMGYELTGDTAGKWKGMGALTQWNFIVFNASAPQEQKDAGIAFFNWLASSQDNLDLWLMGIDGVNYKKEANLGFSEITGTDATRNYRRMWYVSGMGGRFQRQPSDLPQDARDALKFFTTESNWVFNPYERFQVDTKAVQTDLAQIAAVIDEASHGVNSGQTPVADAVKKWKTTLDGAGRQTLKDKLQKQFDDWRAANPNG